MAEAAASAASGSAESVNTVGAASPIAGADAEQKAGAEAVAKSGAKTEAGKKDEPTEQAKQEALDKEAADKQAEEAAKALLYSGIPDLQLPDGVVVDEADGKEFSDILTRSKLSKVDAQKLADLSIKTSGMAVQRQMDALVAQADATLKSWNAELADDKELGGARLQETYQTADKFFDIAAKVPGVNMERFKQDMIRSHMSNQPDFIRIAHYLGKMAGNDKLFIPDGSNAGNAPKSNAEVLYGG